MNEQEKKKAHMRAVQKYEKDKYDKILLRIDKEDHIKERIGQSGMSVNGFITTAIKEKLEGLGL